MEKLLEVSFCLILVITLSFSVACGQKKTNVQRVDEPIKSDTVLWEEIISNEGNFKVQFPGKVEKLIGSNPNTKSGKYFEYRSATRFASYSVSFGDFNLPKELTGDELKNFYDIFRTKISESDKREFLSEKDFKIGNISGREVTYKKGNLILVDRYILVGKRLHQLLTTTSEEFNKNKTAIDYRVKFLESFQFLDK